MSQALNHAPSFDPVELMQKALANKHSVIMQKKQASLV